MILFSVADLTLALDYPSDVVFEDLLPPTYRFFLHSPGAGANRSWLADPSRCGENPEASMTARITVRAGDTSKTMLDPGCLLFRNRECWALYKDGDDYCLVVETSHGSGPLTVTSFTKDIHEVSIIYNQSLADERVRAGRGVRNPFDYPVDRMVVASLLASRDGLLCHAAGACFGGKGYLCTGFSGAGKTTLSALLASTPGWSILSDERVAVRPSGPGWTVFGTPWAGEGRIASPAGCDLAGVIFIRHGEKDRLQPLSSSEALLRFLSLVTVSWYDTDRMPGQLGTAERLISSVPCYELSFRPSPAVGELLTSLALSAH